MSDLASWLLEQIADDEAAAKAAASLGTWPSGDWWAEGRWWLEGVEMLTVGKGGPGADVLAYTYAEEERAHIARHDPARVLAECEAKRAIVGVWIAQWSLPEDGEPSRPLGGQGAEVYYDVLCLLARPYADRPGFREEWR